MRKTVLSTVSAVTLLTACGGSSNPFDGGTNPIDPATDPIPSPVSEASVVENANGTLTLSFDGETIDLPEPSAITPGGEDILTQGNLFGELEQTGEYLAVAGTNGSDFFAAATGTIVAPPTASATFDGRYEVVTASGSEKGDVTVVYDLGEGSLSGSDTRFEIDATASGQGNLSGTVTFDNATATYDGGFFGSSTDFAGGFANEDLAGIFYGTQQ